MLKIPGILIFLFFFGCAVRTGNSELASMAKEDQLVRTGKKDAGSDEERRRRVLELLAEGAVITPLDKFNAGLVLQHTGLRFCGDEMQSLSAENYLLAHFLFRQAMKGGVKDAAYMTAASIDRYLSYTQGFQKYGTNRVFDQSTGEEYLVPIDRGVTDEERAIYGVPALQELLKNWPEQPGKAGPDSVGG
ncbi:hypothetical protein JW964_03865 [candidate division KSB1 bacterium]|nr:hypothetical protein [candidate division KSB1 bacterium]